MVTGILGRGTTQQIPHPLWPYGLPAGSRHEAPRGPASCIKLQAFLCPACKTLGALSPANKTKGLGIQGTSLFDQNLSGEDKKSEVEFMVFGVGNFEDGSVMIISVVQTSHLHHLRDRSSKIC